jgi:hypothetical protein
MAEVHVRHLAEYGFTLEDAVAPFSFGDAEKLRAICEEAGLKNIDVVEASIEATFPASGFVENMEFAYAAVMPHFAEDPKAFDAFVEAVTRDTAELREQYRRGETITFPMHTHIVTAFA